MRIRKLLSLTVLLSAVSLVVYLLAQIGLNYQSRSSLQLEQIWLSDVTKLKEKRLLPTYWNDLKEVEKITSPGDRLAATWAKSAAVPVSINPEGKHKLEILIVSDHDDDSLKAIIRLHITHIPSGNSVWELSRIYNLD